MTSENDIFKRIPYLQRIIEEKEKALKGAPEGRLKGIHHGNKWQYYHRENKHDRNGIYIPKKNQALAKALAQKDYDERVLNAAKKELFHLTFLQKQYQAEDSAEEVYEKRPKSHQILIKPIVEPYDEFLNAWLSQEYASLGFKEDDPEYYSEKGERMRSKSEVWIANTLKRYDIPYLYEKPLYLKGFGTVHPDFTIMKKETRKEIYWEHLGMMDDADYVSHAMSKITEYEKNGYFLGEGLIISYETMRQPINMRLIESKIRGML